MKNLKIAAVIAVSGFAICGLAIERVHRTGALGHSAMQHPVEIDSMVEHLAEVFPRFAEYDANKNGQLDANEKELLARAMADGTLKLPGHTPPNGVEPGGKGMINHIGEMFVRIARYDENHDGALDAKEQAAIKNAFQKGELVWPHD
jgi:hypothetical protein